MNKIFYTIQIIFVTTLLLPSPAEAQLKIMPLGDSITSGLSGPERDSTAYRDELATLLANENIDFDFIGTQNHGTGFDSDHEGHGGFRANKILDNIDSYLSANSPEMVLIHIGTNDVWQDEPNISTKDEIGRIIDAIVNNNADTRIVLASIIPRIDEKNDLTSKLRGLLQQLYIEKRDAGTLIFYAGINEVFRSQPNWASEYFQVTDPVHPTDSGFNIMAQVWFNSITTAINAGNDPYVTDNFERSEIGITWDTDPEFEIRNGALTNTATKGSSNFAYMATYKGLLNPTRVALRWANTADSDGISRGGLALMLDSPSRNASGFLAWITTDDNMLRLWTIKNGTADQNLHLETPSNTNAPGAGDLFQVDLRGNADTLMFDYFINTQAAGTISTTNPGIGNELYSGILLRHNRNNDIAGFMAQGNGDFEPPATVTDLMVVGKTATSVKLSWTATGDDGTTGRAEFYDLRYSTKNIRNQNDFDNALPANRLPLPALPGIKESYIELELEPGTNYYFAIKIFDDAGNPSELSPVASTTTDEGKLFLDDFNRGSLGSQWKTRPVMRILSNELANTSSDQSTWDLATYTAQANPREVSFKWSPGADSIGIDQGGIAVMLNSPNNTARGYLLTRRTLTNEIRLWQIENGQNPGNPISKTPLLTRPQPGDEFRIRLTSDAAGNHFTVYINGWQDITISDPDFFVDPGSAGDLYSGVMLAGGHNNNLDDFKILIQGSALGVDNPAAELVAEFVLSQNYPNPFNPETKIEYSLPVTGPVLIRVFNILGQPVQTLFDGFQNSGNYTITWNGLLQHGQRAGSGTYFLRMEAGSFVQVKRMVLVH